MARLMVPSGLKLTELNTLIRGNRDNSLLTKKVLVLYTTIIKKMFRKGFRPQSDDDRFVQIGLAEREAIFRKDQVKVFELLEKNLLLEVKKDIDKETGEEKDYYRYGSAGSSAKRYAIPARLLNGKPKFEIIKEENHKIKKVTANLARDKEKKVKEIQDTALLEMVETLKKVKFCNEKATLAIINDNTPMKLLNAKSLGNLTLFDYMTFLNGNLCEEYYQDYYGERLQHFKMYVPKALRYCCMYFEGYDNEEVSELDIANSQPYFFCCLSPELVEKLLPEFASEELTYILTKMRQAECFQRFQEICIQGKLKEEFSKVLSDKFTKAEIKEIIFSVMYCDYNKKNKQHRRQLEAFKSMFPGVYEGLRAIKELNWTHLKENCNPRSKKKGNYTNASLIIQRLESRVILGQVVPIINRQVTKTFFTIHDSIVCLKKDEENIKDTMIQCFKNLGLEPPVINNKKEI